MRVDDVGGTSGSTAKTTPTVTPARPAETPPTPAQTAEALVERATPIGTTRPDVRQLAGLVSQQAAIAPAQAPAVRKQVEALLTPVEVGQLKRDMAAYDINNDIDRDGLVSQREKAAVLTAGVFKALGIEPPVTNLHLNDPDYKGIPQGQGFDAKTNEFFTTYYAQVPGNKKEGYDVRLSVQDKATGFETSYVKLKTEYGRELAHGGGVATSGKWIFVSDGGRVYTYDRSKIEAAGAGGIVQAEKSQPTPGSSFMNISPDGKYAYVGQFKKPEDGTASLYRYEIDQKTGALVNGSGPQFIPHYAQGVAITKEGLIFTTSYGSSDHSPNELYFVKFNIDPSKGFSLEQPEQARVMGELPHYAEGVNVIGDDLYVTFESGAGAYQGEEGISRIMKYPLSDFE